MYLARNNLLTLRNSGFRTSEETVNQFVNIIHNIYHDMNQGDDSSMVFLDASKPFDKVWHKGLIYKLQQLGVNPTFTNWLKSYLHKRKIRTVIDGDQSSWSHIYAEVPQGSILGPLLFLVYVNNIVCDIESNIYLFADDTSMSGYRQKEPCDAFDMLNRHLDRLCQWAEIWHVTHNPAKTEYVIFSHRHKSHYPALLMKNQALARVEYHTHLGLTLDAKMTWKVHHSSIITTANKLIGIIW
jgi:hypothetical protein